MVTMQKYRSGWSGQFAHSSKYYDLQKWTASCPLTIEHMRLLQPNERALMNRNRKKKFLSILAHQVREQMDQLHRKNPEHAKTVLKETTHLSEERCYVPVSAAKTLKHIWYISPCSPVIYSSTLFPFQAFN